MSLSAVFLHGFLGSPADWGPVQSALESAAGALVPALPGHGTESPCEPDFFIRRQRRALPPRYRLVGYSLGGRIALRWALTYPSEVESLVLISTSPGIDDEPGRSARRQSDAAWAVQLRAGDREAFLRAWYAQPVFASMKAKPDLLEQVCRRRAQAPLADLADMLERMSPGRQPPMWGRLSELAMPVLHLAGEDDPAYLSIAGRAAGLSPHGRARSIPGSGHAVPEEQPTALAAALMTWWQETDPGRKA